MKTLQKKKKCKHDWERLIMEEIDFHPSKDNYKHFEQYTNCEHKKNDQLAADCQACDIDWLISRCRVLEKTITDLQERLGKEK